MTSTNQILQRLKTQPRLGLPAVTPDEAYQKELNRQLSLLKNDMAGLATAIEKLYISAAQSMNEENLNLQTGLSGLIGVFDTYKTSMVTAVKQATFLEQRNKTLNKTFGITSVQSAKLGQKFDKLSKTFGESGDRLRVYSANLNKILPGMAEIINKNDDYSKSLMYTQDILQNQLQLTGEQANNFELYAAGIDKAGISQLGALDAFTTKFEQATGMIGVFKGVTEEIAGLGSDIQMAYGKIPASLELAVMKSKLLGMKFSEIESMAGNMLNIEDSVNKELEYQLVSGKRLVDQQGKSITEKLRMAKITGDANKMAEATADIFTSQKDILEGNNFYAKEQLAQVMGMTQAQLMKAYQTQKLMKQLPGMDEKKVNEILDLDPAAYAAEMKKAENQDKAQIFDELRKNRTEKTTDEKMLDLLDTKRTFKITQVAPDQVQTITGARTRVIGPDDEGGAVTSQMNKVLNKLVGNNDVVAKTLGSLQNQGTALTALNGAMKQLSGAIPVLGPIFSTMTSKIDKAIQFGYGSTTGPGGAGGKSLGGASVNVGNVGTTTTQTPDGILVNDAMIQFHPADKFATVPDGAALLASTERGKLDTAVDTLTGGGGKTAVVDPNPIAAAVAAAVQQAMSGLKIEMDGFNLAKAMEFSNRTINRV
jgi:hypothetical protein